MRESDTHDNDDDKKKRNIMGKSGKKRKNKNRKKKPYDREDAMVMSDVKPQSRGSVEKRHHHELRMWRKEEADLRRQMLKYSKKKPDQLKERKRILSEIKEKSKAMKERHIAELDAFKKKSQVFEELKSKLPVAMEMKD